MEINVVVGGGQAGATAIHAMRSAGFSGEIVLIGKEPYLPYERPPLSKEILLNSCVMRPPLMYDAAYYQERAVQLRLATAAVHVDRRHQRLHLSNGADIPYDRLLLATGSRLRRLAIEGADRSNVRYLRTLDDSKAIERSLRPGVNVLVIGGGFIGMEVAACAVQRGCRVTVVEAGPAILSRLACPPVGEFVADYHRRRGVDIRLNVRPARIDGHEQAETVILSTGDRIAVDLIVVGVGIEPEVDLAEEAGLDVSDGILTDPYCVTSDPQIFAAGDVTKHFNRLLGRRLRLESWQNAQEQALAAGKGMAGDRVAYAEIPWIWSDQFDLNLQFAGVADSATEIVLRGELASGAFTAFLLDGGRLVGAATVNQGREMAVIRRMLKSSRTFTASELADPQIRLRQFLS